MDLKKRGLALLMCICMIMTLLPVAAFADDAAVVYGQYTDDGWAEDPSADGTVTSDNITISKTAEPVSGEADTYRINLSVTTTTTTEQVPPGSAATVLVMDVSGSMDFCAECGADEEHYKGCTYEGDVKSSQSRLTSAKAAANSFLDSYGGTASDSGNGRYVAIVKFASTSSIACGWTDVSTSSGLTKVKNVISGLKADGGTNLDAGLQSAAALLGSDAVNGVTSKNVIALTDGQPTFYGNGIEAHGSYGCPETNAATAKSAATVRALADVYTVCFGVANELCWEKGSVHEWGFLGPSKTHSSNGPTVGAFLRDSIATAASEDKTYAYNADNTAELNKAFEAITQEITSGLTTGLKVTDSAGKYIDMTAPNQYVSVENAYEWTLSDPVVSTDGNTTTYTYSVSYTVKLDTTAEGFKEGKYYPTNGKTYLTYTDENGSEKTLYFEIPGVKGIIPSYNVSYAYTGEVPAGAPAVPASASHKQNSTVSVAAAPVLDGYTFSGWSTNDATVSDGSFKMPGKNVTLTGSWSPRSDLSYTVNYYWNGTTDKVADSKVVSDQTFGDTVTDETPIAIDGYTAVPDQTSNLTIGTGANVINFYYYKNVELTAKSDTVTYDSNEHSVSGFTGAPEGADFSAITVGAKGTEAGEYPAEFAQNTVGTVDANSKYIVTSAIDGKLIINPIGKVTVTITGNTATETYNGSEQTVTGYDVSISNPLYTENDFTFSGNASASGTDAGTYNMGLAAEQFANKNTNFSNVEFVVNDGSLTIEKRNVTMTSATDSKVYDGTALTNATVTVTGDGFVEGEGATYDVTGTITDVGSVDNEFTYTLNANTKAANYNIDTVFGTLSVTPVTDKVTVTVTGNTGGEKYNGSEQTVTGYDVSISNPLYTENDFTFSGNASASGTDAGTYNMGLAAEQFANKNTNFSNVEFVVNDGSLTIEKRNVTMTSATDSKVYDGTALTNATVTVTGDGFVEGEGATYDVTGTITDVGSVDNEFTYTLNENTKASNYNIDTEIGTLSVTPLTGVVVTITEHSSTVPFTGTTQTVTGYDVASNSELYKETDFTFNGNATAAGLIAGYYPMELKPADFTNTNNNFKDVEFKIVDGGLTITPLDTIIVTITGNTATKTYNGSEQKVEGYTVSINSTLYTEDDFDFNGVAAAARTDVGKTMMGLKAEQFTNTNDNFSKVAFNIVDGWIEITPTETELKVVANSNSWVYDGQDHADGGYTVTFGEEKYEVKAGESATLSTGDTVTAFITKTVKHVSDTAEGNNEIVRLAVENEDGYKTVTKLSGTLTITPAPLTITAGSSSQPYVDGVVMCNEYTNTPLVDGDKIESVKITGQQDGPGKSDNVPSDAVIKNAADEDVTGDYDITYVNGVLEGVPKLEKDVHFNYIMGYKDKTIRPNNNITRAEVATIFFRLLTDESREYYWKESNDFKDIPDNYWACPAISTLTNAGILKGFEDGNFRPNEPVTRAQMATIIARFANLSEGTVSFTDIEGHWAQRAIELAAGNGWINGYEDGTFRPNDKITRAATMAMINRVLDRHVENVEDLLPDMNVWSDNMDTSYTFYFDIQEATNFHECQRIDNSPNEKWTVKLEDIDWTVYEF